MAKRRGNGEGSVYRAKDGRWCAALTVGYDENGRRRRRYLYGRTKAEVLEKLAQTAADARSGVLAEPSRVTVLEFAEGWLESAQAGRIRKTTASTYRVLLKKHIAPYLGGQRLARLTPLHVQSWISALERANVAGRQRQAAFVLLKTIVHHALKLGMVARNPLDAIDKPRVPRREVDVLSPDQIRQLLAAAQGTTYEALLTLAIATGARQGELFGVQWRDLDLGAGILTIQRTLVEVAGKLEFGEPKTTRSRRRVDLPAHAVEALRRHRIDQPATPHPAALVFTDSEGHPLRKSNFIRRVWHPLLKAAQLPRVKFHSLRHSHVTTLLAAGGNLKAVSERVGHSRTSMTADVYAHAVEGMQRELAEKLDRIYG